MNTSFDKSLQELLRNHTEQPALDCWDKISSRLDALQSAGSASNASQFSQFVGSVAGKIAITATIAVSIAAATYFVLNNSDETPPIAQQQEVSINEQVPDLFSSEPIFETETEKVYALDKIIPTNNFTSIDTVIEKKIEDNSNLSSPIINSPVNQSDMNLAANEPTPQPKETPQPPQPTKKEPKVKPIQEEEKEETAEVQEEVNEPKQPKLGIPNIFTPNGDGNNDYFVIINIEQVGENQLDVYTREGRVVYSKHFYDNRWDGYGLPDGTYLYIFRFMYEGNWFMRRGTITIKR